MINFVDEIDKVRGTFGDHLAPSELAFLRETQNYVGAVIEQKLSFEAVVKIVATKLQSFICTTSSERPRFAFDTESFRETFQQDFQRLAEVNLPLTEQEALFSADVIDAIEFVVCNGIGFGLIAVALGHDLNEIKQAGSLEASCFNPKVSGWAKYQRALIGIAQDEE